VKTIWKYPLNINDETQRIRFRKDAQILTVQMQNGEAFLWAKVDSEAPEEYRTITSFGTGHKIPENWNLQFISTVQDDPYVWHFFELLSTSQEPKEGT
jgi:hypothetical protein